MTPPEARIVLLEDALVDSYNLIDFLHNCLVNPSTGTMGQPDFKGGYSYGYPDQTIKRLEKIRQLVDIPSYCHHSGHNEDCESCQRLKIYRHRLAEAKQTLSEQKE